MARRSKRIQIQITNRSRQKKNSATIIRSDYLCLSVLLDIFFYQLPLGFLIFDIFCEPKIEEKKGTRFYCICILIFFLFAKIFLIGKNGLRADSLSLSLYLFLSAYTILLQVLNKNKYYWICMRRRRLRRAIENCAIQHLEYLYRNFYRHTFALDAHYAYASILISIYISIIHTHTISANNLTENEKKNIWNHIVYFYDYSRFGRCKNFHSY